MASQSLYRKWRSQTFSDLIGQEAVTRTLLNAVRDGRLAHAYLFCGPRGTGKTSAARLLAKAINCPNSRNGEPCNECVSCVEIAAGRSPDVIEIDAASNNGVDDVRKIRENTNLIGSGGRYKVYVVDEVHMLSTPAFNALLKTLEEPPEHVIFVLATTEAHKVLQTVVSRCQRFDFRRIRLADIVARLKHVAAGEGLTIEPAAADLLARAAQGGLRDALSLLDQAVAFCGTTIDLERARAMLGLADVGSIRRLITCIAEQHASDALDLLNELVTTGADLRQLNSQFAEEWRALMLASAGADLTRVMDFTEDEARDLATLSQQFTLDELMACARVFSRNDGPARGLPVPQLALELSLLECLSIRRRDARPMPLAHAGPAVSAPPTQPAPPRAEPPVAAAPNPSVAPARPAVAQPEELDLDAIEEGKWSGPSRAPVAPRAETPAAPLPSVAAPIPPRVEAAPAQPVYAQESADATSSADEDERDWVEESVRNWALIRKVCRQKPPMGAVASGFLSAADPIRYNSGSPGTLVIRTKFEAHLSKFRDPDMRAAVEWALEQILGRPMLAQFVFGSEPQRGMAPVRRESNVPPAGGSVAAAQSAAPRPQVYERSVPASNGHQPSQSSAPKPRPTAPQGGQNEIRERPPTQPAPAAKDLERAAREDPVVQEFARMLKAEVAEVRALDPGDVAEHGDA